MTDNRKAGIALILGTVGEIVTMAIHPHGSVPPAEFEHMALVSAIAHSLAMASSVVLFLGALQLMFRLSSREASGDKDRLAIAGLATFGFAIIAILLATAVSGFIAPAIMRKILADTPANGPEWNRILTAVFQFNQAFAKIYSVAASVAIILWSASALRNGGLGRFASIYGCALSPVLIVLIAVGHIQLNVHGMAIIVLVHGIWFVAAGIDLYRATDQATPTEALS